MNKVTDPTPSPPLEGRGVPHGVPAFPLERRGVPHGVPAAGKAVATPLPCRGGAGVGSVLFSPSAGLPAGSLCQ